MTWTAAFARCGATRCSASGRCAQRRAKLALRGLLGDRAVDRIGNWLEIIPPSMREPVLFAVPFFSAVADDRVDGRPQLEHLEDRPTSGAYMARDAWASISMGLVSVATMGHGSSGAVGLCGPLRLRGALASVGDEVATWVIALVGVDLLLLLPPHRASRTTDLGNPPGTPLQSLLQLRDGAASEVEQQRRNRGLDAIAAVGNSALDGFSAAFRSASSTSSGSTPSGSVGCPGPSSSCSTPRLTTESITGSTSCTSTRTTAESFIVWDRMFGSFQPEVFRPHYGLTKQVTTFNVWKLQTHEYAAIARDVKRADRWRDRIGATRSAAGWKPAAQPLEPAQVRLSKQVSDEREDDQRGVKEILLPESACATNSRTVTAAASE